MSTNGHFRSSARPQIATRIEVTPEAGGEPVFTYTRDISTGGLFMEDACALVPGQRVTVRLPIPSSWSPLELEAVVCRIEEADVDNGGAGLKFEDLTPEQSHYLAVLLSSLDYGG